MSLKKVVSLFEELRLLGFEGSLFRIYYEFTLRTGLKKIFSSKIPKVRVNVTLDEWSKNKSKCFLLSLEEAKSVLNSILNDGNKAEIIKIANETIKGSITCFSKWAGDYKGPIDWHYNPKRKVSWPTNVHWSKVMRFEKFCGDVKLTWEVNRFPHLYYLVRAYVLKNDGNYVKAFSEQLKCWEEANPYGFGVNWNSGQELAIRVLSWIYALYMMGDNNNFKDSDFQRLLRLLYLHALYIEKNIKYAYYAVHNNHLIGEALGLYAIGTLFPYFSESIRWRNKGKAILESEKCLKQFYEDGGYCQLSFNYQRLVLHYYLWALKIAEANGDRFMGEILNILDRSAKFLYSFINLEDGKLPNWGANDGALLNPWTSCDYSDYRPLINSLSYITRKKRAFSEGSWDEELFWFFGTEALEANVEPYQLKSQSFPVTGLHILRGDNVTFATFRCGSVTDRFGQADQLHVDVWWKDLNIAIDGGSYLYNDELEYHKYFMGTSSHNTVIVNGEDQMLLFRRFKWLYWTKAKLLNFSGNIAEGEHYGYGRLEANILHNRKVRMIDNGSFLIIDQLTQKKGDYVHYDLHWLLNDFKYKIEQLNGNSFKMVLFTPKGRYYIFISSDVESRLLMNRALEDKNKPDGWQSRYYGEKTPALSLHFICDFNKGVRFLTFFTGKEGNFGYLEEIIRGENAHTLNS